MWNIFISYIVSRGNNVIKLLDYRLPRMQHRDIINKTDRLKILNDRWSLNLGVLNQSYVGNESTKDTSIIVCWWDGGAFIMIIPHFVLLG